jgi:hypothetical protein
MLLAGGGVRGGQVLGASDRAAAYPALNPVGPWDLGATLLHLAGFDPAVRSRAPRRTVGLRSPEIQRHAGCPLQ